MENVLNPLALVMSTFIKDTPDSAAMKQVIKYPGTTPLNKSLPQVAKLSTGA